MSITDRRARKLALVAAFWVGSGAWAQSSPPAESAPAPVVSAYREIHAFDKAERARLEFARASGQSALDVAMLATESLPRRM